MESRGLFFFVAHLDFRSVTARPPPARMAVCSSRGLHRKFA